jgi:hypothetical protein
MSTGCLDPILGCFGLRGTSASQPPAASAAPSASTETLVETPPAKAKADAAPAPLRKDSKILIVGGGGTIGASTALHLARRGYTNVHVLDVFPIPSGNSAGNDLNKARAAEACADVRAHEVQIVGFSLDQRGFRGALSRKYMEGWTTDPVFAPHYHATGCASISFLSFLLPRFSLTFDTAI